MMNGKKILCVGLYDNGLSLLLKLLLKKKKGTVKFLRSVGVDDHAHNELAPPQSVVNIAREIGFVLTQYDQPHPSLAKEAQNKNLELIHHRPAHISRFKNLGLFDLVVTPYRSVYPRLLERFRLDRSKVCLIDHPNGMASTISPAEAYPHLKAWVDEHF